MQLLCWQCQCFLFHIKLDIKYGYSREQTMEDGVVFVSVGLPNNNQRQVLRGFEQFRPPGTQRKWLRLFGSIALAAPVSILVCIKKGM